MRWRSGWLKLVNLSSVMLVVCLKRFLMIGSILVMMMLVMMLVVRLVSICFGMRLGVLRKESWLMKLSRLVKMVMVKLL